MQRCCVDQLFPSPHQKKVTFELSSIWSLSNIWPCPENSTCQPPGALFLFLQRLMRGYLMSFNSASDLSENRVFCNPCSKMRLLGKCKDAKWNILQGVYALSGKSSKPGWWQQGTESQDTVWCCFLLFACHDQRGNSKSYVCTLLNAKKNLG